ncbi:MAG: cytochrome c oxidase accessory protein CcoG [Thiobacillaceae bacterium]
MDIPPTQTPAASNQDSDVERSLYAIRQKIFPRAVHGWFANWRIFFVLLTQGIFYGLPWVTWNGRQAVLFDLINRKFYIFDWVFFPQDFIWLTGLLIISAYALFLFTAIAGRLWCGFTCPQTVYTEMFLWVERKLEGDRPKQIKLDKQPWNAEKILRRGSKHLIWILIGFWTGFSFVGYFTPIQTLGFEFLTWTLGPWETFWVFFYGFATYGNAGFMREQVCKYMCPYARFQSVMFDPDTLIVSYDPGMGEPRGARSRSTDYKAAGLGTCIDCSICVQVCPVGIDIRNGLQYECIGCAACIDGCNQVMEKMGYPKGLIRYTTERVLKGNYTDKNVVSHIFRPRVLAYTAILSAICIAFVYTLATRIPLRVDVIRDRNMLSRENDLGQVENLYRVEIINMDDLVHRYRITVRGVEGMIAKPQNDHLIAEPLATLDMPVLLVADPVNLKSRTTPVEIVVTAEGDPKLSKTAKTTFLSR